MWRNKSGNKESSGTGDAQEGTASHYCSNEVYLLTVDSKAIYHSAAPAFLTSPSGMLHSDHLLPSLSPPHSPFRASEGDKDTHQQLLAGIPPARVPRRRTMSHLCSRAKTTNHPMPGAHHSSRKMGGPLRSCSLEVEPPYPIYQ